MPTVVGLDLSLTGSGVAVYRDERHPRLQVIGSAPAGASIKDRWKRLGGQAEAIFEFIEPGWLEDSAFVSLGERSLCVVEQPAYAQTQGSQHDRSGLWWAVMSEMAEAFDLVAEVPPSTLKKFATGKGNASKAEMMARTAQDFPGQPFKDDNDSDALWLATMGRAHIDADLAGVSMTKYRTEALKAVGWR